MPSVVPALVSSFGCTAVGASECSPSAVRARSIFARPKSRILACPRETTKMLAGFRSRWTIPFACADSSASAIWVPSSSSALKLERPAPDPVGERLALEQLHRDEVLPLVLVDLVDRADPGVIERRGRPRLALEALERAGLLGHLHGQELERHVAAELGVLGLVHDAHAAAAELRGDPVVGDGLADHGCISRRHHSLAEALGGYSLSNSGSPWSRLRSGSRLAQLGSLKPASQAFLRAPRDSGFRPSCPNVQATL